jgi:replicative DNA helicase
MKIPPHSVEAERGVLGSVLIDAEGLHKIADLVKVEDFYEPSHASIYRAMLDLSTKGRPIDVLTLREILDDRGELKTIGGDVFLMELTNTTFSSANVYQYGQIVKNKSMLRKLIKAGNEIAMYGYDEETELNTLLERTEQAIFGVTQTFIQNRLIHIREILGLRYEEFVEINADPDILKRGVSYAGFAKLDTMIGGFKPGDMVILAARPSMGKTALMLNVAQNMGMHKKHVAIFSLEMSKEQLTDRMIAAAMGIDSWKLQKGEITDDEFVEMGNALERLSQANIYIDDSPIGNLIEIKSKARRLKMESGLDCVMIDYLQLL